MASAPTSAAAASTRPVTPTTWMRSSRRRRASGTRHATPPDPRPSRSPRLPSKR
ncbi:hypothetical protein ACFPRL_01790 [Pseudoclavibacter helvolus]